MLCREMFDASMTSHRKGLGSDVWCEPPAVEITAICEVVNPTMLAKDKTARQEVLWGHLEPNFNFWLL